MVTYNSPMDLLIGYVHGNGLNYFGAFIFGNCVCLLGNFPNTVLERTRRTYKLLTIELAVFEDS